VNLNEKQIAAAQKYATKIGHTINYYSPKDIKAYRKDLLRQLKAADKILAIIAPPKAKPE
jgi:hypothetical protein